MSIATPLEIVEIPGWPGRYARRFIVEMWQDAGSPPINDAGRLKDQQQRAWNAYQNGTGSPADDPNRPHIFPLAHVRFVALDVPPVYGPAMRRAGFVMPYSYEPWHFQVAGDVRRFDLVTSLPVAAGSGETPFPEEDDMFTDEDRARLDAVYAALFGPVNVGGKELTWSSVDGPRSARYGLLDIDINTQRLAAEAARDSKKLLALEEDA